MTAEVIRDHHLLSPLGDPEFDAENESLHTESPGETQQHRAGYTSPNAFSFDPILPATSDGLNLSPDGIVPDITSPVSARHSENAVAGLMYLSKSDNADITGDQSMPLGSMSMDLMTDCFNFDEFTPDSGFEDGVFLPGSTYHELHTTLRHHLIQEVNSSVPTQAATPDASHHGFDTNSEEGPISDISKKAASADENSLLTKEEELYLWRNWFAEIAPWLDKFDSQCHFQLTLPTMASSNSHLYYAIMALSSRQLEQKDADQPMGRSLTLYQEAIHQLLPHLAARNTAVIASCVILCVLEMLSCSPKAWRRHLDGCATLMEAVGINGFVGGVEAALFWCFARMDVCGGLILSIKTLIPTSHWASKMGLDADVNLFRSQTGYDNWANYSVYLNAQVLDLLAPDPDNPSAIPSSTGTKYRTDWLKLWNYLSDWHTLRPAPLHSIITIPSSDTSPFPTTLFSNAAAISSNQLYHTASILMLQNQPPKIRLNPKPRSILWHARQICAISMSNDDHGAWTNSIQPLWIAGRCMSHPAEHKAILELLAKIEVVSGWSTKWRADDLKEFWGDIG